MSSLLIASTMIAQVPVAPNQPDVSKILDIRNTNHDFGKVAYGKPVEFEVEIKNISNDSVKIETVKVGCGCTTPRYEAGKSFGPGETIKVTLGFNGMTEGPFSKTADLIFNNGLTKQIVFRGEGYKVPEAPAPTNGAVEKMKKGSK